MSWECERGDRCSQAAHRCRDRVKIAAFACEGSRRPRTSMLPSARSVLENARLAPRDICERGARARKRPKGFSLSVGYGRLEASTIQSLDDLSWVDGDEDDVLVSFSRDAGSFGLYPAVLSSTADSMLFCFEDGRKLQSSKVYSPAIFAVSFTHLSVCVVHLNGHRSWLHTCFCCLTQASFWTPLMQ